MRMRRVWAMPHGDTFDCSPIRDFVKGYLRESSVSVDPFARNKRWASYTNDLDPRTEAEFHMPALDFLRKLKADEVRADLVIFDPPYSPRQIKELYDSIGLETYKEMAHKTAGWSNEREAVHELLEVGGIFLWFNWNSLGMGIERNYEDIELLLVSHGAGHNDTICLAQRKNGHQVRMWETAE